METKTTRGVKPLPPTTVNNIYRHHSHFKRRSRKCCLVMIKLQKIKRNANTHFFLTLSHSLSLYLCKKSNQLWIVCYGVRRGGGDGGAPREAARQRTKRGGDSGKQRQRKREKWQGRANKYECGLCRLG